jgi:hypothetical protein
MESSEMKEKDNNMTPIEHDDDEVWVDLVEVVVLVDFDEDKVGLK